MDSMMVEYRLKNRVNEITSAATDALSLIASTGQSIRARFEQLVVIEEIALSMGKNIPRRVNIELNTRIKEIERGIEEDDRIITGCLETLQTVPVTIRAEFAAADKQIKRLESR